MRLRVAGCGLRVAGGVEVGARVSSVDSGPTKGQPLRDVGARFRGEVRGGDGERLAERCGGDDQTFRSHGGRTESRNVQSQAGKRRPKSPVQLPGMRGGLPVPEASRRGPVR